MLPTVITTDQVSFLKEGAKIWKDIKNHRHYKDYMKVGQRLALIRQLAHRQTGTNDSMSGKYRAAFSELCKLYGYDGMDKSLRSDLLFLQEPQYTAIADEIRAGMSEAQKLRISHPHAMVLRVRKYIKDLQDEPKRRATEALAAAADRDEQHNAEPETDPERIAAHFLSKGTAREVANLVLLHRSDDPAFIKTLIDHLAEQL